MGRIRYGIKNLHYALATTGEGGALTYATPVALPGAKALSLSPTGDALDEYADNVRWYHLDSNQGYEGTLEVEDTAELDTFLQAVLSWQRGQGGALFEHASDQQLEFALLGQFELAGGTETGKRFALFRCIIARPELSGQTKEESITVNTNTLNLTVLPRVNDDLVKASCTSEATAYSTWFEAVPTYTPGQ